MKEIILKEGIKKMSCEDVCVHFQKLIYKLSHKWDKYEFDDISQTAYIGLIKAYEKYDHKREVVFITYATKVIENEILQSLRKDRKTIPTESLHNEVNGREALELIGDKKNYEEMILNKVIVNKVIKNLKEREKQMISAQMKGLTQVDISKMLGVSQSRVSRMKKSIYKKMKEATVS